MCFLSDKWICNPEIAISVNECVNMCVYGSLRWASTHADCIPTLRLVDFRDGLRIHHKLIGMRNY